jgi:uncharacterized membrane protein (UPF0127 family)
VVSQLAVPRTILGRGLGLMLRRELPEDHGMWINPCNGIHMFFMRFAVDAVFLDRRLRVVRIVPGLRPWRMVPLVLEAQSVVELPAGLARAAGLEVGEQLGVIPG